MSTKAAVSQILDSLRPRGREIIEYDCEIPDTGETFTAVVESVGDRGRVVTVKNLGYPPGFVPDGLPVDPSSVQRKSWIYQNHFKKILDRFVGVDARSPTLMMHRKDLRDKISKAIGS